MTKKKTISVANVSENGSLKLDDPTRLALNWYSAEERAATQTANLKRLQLELFLQKVDPSGVIRRLESEIQELSKTAQKFQEEYRGLCETTAVKLNMDTASGWSFDDQTGIIHQNPAPEK